MKINVGFGRSTAQKAVQTNKKAVAFVGASYGNTDKWRIFENGVEIFE